VARLTEAQTAFLSGRRVGRLATADAEGRPHVIPVCYACDGDAIYIAIDAKPKRVAPAQLKRLANIRQNPKVALIVDDYSEDWTRLAYLMIRGEATILESGAEHDRALVLLRAKYSQYNAMSLEERPVIRIGIERAVQWASAGAGDRARDRVRDRDKRGAGRK
jgi:PPOX class probable F420-dependent enzyme